MLLQTVVRRPAALQHTCVFKNRAHAQWSPLGVRRKEARSFAFAAALDSCYGHTHEALVALHATTGLSWAWTLPLAAVCIRTLLVLPLELWARKHRNLAAHTRPLLYAWAPLERARIRQENPTLSVAEQIKLHRIEMRAKRLQLQKRLGIKTYPALAPLLQLPVWLIAMETVRKMCGAREGLLGLIAKSRESISTGDPVQASETVAIEVPHETTSTLLEPTLAAEGALWFPDLLMSDPMHALPFALSGLLFANIWFNQRIQRAEGIEPTKWTIRISRIMQSMALFIGPATLAMPAAMHVYWLSSSACAMIQHALVWKFLPRPPSATPCKGGASTAAFMKGPTT